MTPKQLERIALSLPDVTESPHFDRRSFRVAKKIFMTMTADGKEAMVGVAAREAREALSAAHPDTFFSYGGWTERNGAVGVRLALVEESLMKALVIESWKSRAPKRLLAGLVEATVSSPPTRPKAPRARGASARRGARRRG
jgi:hypothetical protein